MLKVFFKNYIISRRRFHSLTMITTAQIIEMYLHLLLKSCFNQDKKNRLEDIHPYLWKGTLLTYTIYRFCLLSLAFKKSLNKRPQIGTNFPFLKSIEFAKFHWPATVEKLTVLSVVLKDTKTQLAFPITNKFCLHFVFGTKAYPFYLLLILKCTYKPEKSNRCYWA